jgi:hypothetical protein
MLFLCESHNFVFIKKCGLAYCSTQAILSMLSVLHLSPRERLWKAISESRRKKRPALRSSPLFGKVSLSFTLLEIIIYLAGRGKFLSVSSVNNDEGRMGRKHMRPDEMGKMRTGKRIIHSTVCSKHKIRERFNHMLRG